MKSFTASVTFFALVSSCVHAGAYYRRPSMPHQFRHSILHNSHYFPFAHSAPSAMVVAPTPVAPTPAVVPAEAPAGYSFSYDIEAGDGRQSRQESGDANGNVVGEYAINLSDGRMRTVQYTAGSEGFKARIASNEQGIDLDKAPADVTYMKTGSPVASQAPRHQHIIHAHPVPTHHRFHGAYFPGAHF